MRLMFTSGTTGNTKVIPYSQGMMEQLGRTMDSFLKYGNLNPIEGRTLNSYNFFTSKAPNLAYWQTTQLGNYDWIMHFDVGDIPIEKTKMLFKLHPPDLISGLPETLKTVINFIGGEYFLNITHIIAGGEAIDKYLIDLVKEKTKAELLCVYGVTETGMCFITQYGRRSEGYIIIDHDVQIKKNEIFINGIKTGDYGRINDMGKLDLNIVRKNGREKICGK